MMYRWVGTLGGLCQPVCYGMKLQLQPVLICQQIRHWNSNPRKIPFKFLQPKVSVDKLNANEPVSGSVDFGDQSKMRKFEWNAKSLNARGFLYSQREYNPPIDTKQQILNLSKSLIPQLRQLKESDIIKFELEGTQTKFDLLPQAFSQLNHYVPNSMLYKMQSENELPPNLRMQKEPIRFNPDTDSLLGRSTAFPKTSTLVTGLRAKKKYKGFDEQGNNPKLDVKSSFPVMAYATCEELNLERLHRGLVEQDLYIPTVLYDDMDDVIHVAAKYKICDEPREIFFFRDGAVVFWNMPETECLNVLTFLKHFEHESYDMEQVTQELEYMRYYYHDQGASRLSQGRIVLNTDSANKILEKYAFANAMASSVKLGIWESTLDKFVDSIAPITEVLKRAEKLEMSREEVLQKTGELFSLRHELNLNSDLLDTPDFYWERERLESIYQKTCNYLNMHRRTKVLNEKMTQCSELLELISTHLNDRHHTRLEWMIIALITIEVGFEILHVVERYT